MPRTQTPVDGSLQQPPARRELVARQELVGLCATSIGPGRRGRSRCPGAAASRRPWRRRRWLRRVWPTSSQSCAVDAARSARQQRRAVGEQLERERRAAGARRPGAPARPASSDGMPGSEPDADVHLAAVGHHVDRRAAVDRADVERRRRGPRETARACGGALRLQLAGAGARAPRSPGAAGSMALRPRCGIAAVGGDAVEGRRAA